jgi:alginate O-acetyltransferase complex protein AlgI
VNFVQIEFLALFAATFTVYWLLPTRRLQNLLLVGVSAVFYGWVHPWFLALLYGSATLDFFVARGIRAAPWHRRKLLALSVAGNLGVLAFFKYFDFFLANVSDALLLLGAQPHLSTLGVILPVGISFYTFQTLSYSIDVYRGVLEPRRDFIDYLAFVTFFSQLVAGPIERAARLLPQIEAPRRFQAAMVVDGLGLALWGGFKKIVIADTLAPYVDKVFMLADPPGAVLWAGALAFGVQLYADFSAYTDIARGTARMLGFDLVRNFDQPFLATSTPDFWRRWHMSLSFWIRDYLLVPLLGRADVVPPLRVASAVVVTFLLIGLWHGAGWNYVIFGAWHAAWVLVYLAIVPRLPARLRSLPGATAVAVAIHTLLVQVPGSMMFRESRPGMIPHHLLTPPWDGDGFALTTAVEICSVVGALAVPLAVVWLWGRAVSPRLPEVGVWALPVRTAGWGVLVLGMVVFYRETSTDFIYFQF